MLNRRNFSLVSAATLVNAGGGIAAAAVGERFDAARELRALAQACGGRLGVYAFDPGVPAPVLALHENERFPMCSTFKILAVAAILARVDRGDERLERRVAVRHADLLEYAPVSRLHLGGSMTVVDLCSAAIVYSDNTAANLLLTALGGPAHVTRYVRSLGDRTTRLDRTEPALNTSIPGDLRDTTTPLAMAQTVARIVFGDALSSKSKTLLSGWLVACKTGSARLRAGFPAGWRSGDKTGTGDNASTNDVAVAWPRANARLVVVALFTGSPLPARERERVLARVGRIAGRAWVSG